MRRRNRVEQVVMTGCNPEDKGNRRGCLSWKLKMNTQKRSKGHQYGVTIISVKLEKLVMGSSFDMREAVREYLRSITGLDDERYSKRPT
ncbi:hypothetical protein DY000_02018200 [Brassica cretica]|uniref:MBD domain-containing protein n=1 Tax=Brassica cretica TaxID=69181 RepID=A0ABQ7CQK1_BRACR|nr:hypothetical protein DY000_02018200 [Brassica cretica]